MKNKILLSLVASAVLASSSFANNASDIKELKAQVKDLQAYIEDVEDNLGTVETRSYTDKIQLGLGMRVEMNNYTNTYANGKDYKANDIWRTKLNINMKSKIADNLKFSGRLSMYKNWGDSTTRNTNFDSMQGRRPDGSQLYVERAYLDWSLNKGATIPVIVTMGRQPSSDGPSYQIKEDTTRKGTYDALSADGAADGIVLTALLNNISKGTSLRFAYGTPNVLDNEAYSNQQMNYSGKDRSSYENTKVWGLFLDQTIPSLKFQNLFQAYYMSAKDMNANPQNLDPSLYKDGNATKGVNPSFMQSKDENVGDLTITGAMFEASKINGNIDLFAHYSKSVAKPNGKGILMGTDSDRSGGITQNEYKKYGLLGTSAANANVDTSSKSGDAIWIGGRYTLNKTWKVGAEYNKGSKNWFSFTSGSNDPLNKLSTRGTATEIYTSYAVNKHANLRVGLVNIKYDYTGSGSHLGSPMKISDLTTAQGSGQIIEKTKNAYITFNVLF